MTHPPFLLNEYVIRNIIEAIETSPIFYDPKGKQELINILNNPQILENQEIVERLKSSLDVLYHDTSGGFFNRETGLQIETASVILLLETILGAKE